MPVNPTDQQEFSDADFRIVDNGDQSKKLAFQVSGVTTATTRTLTAPNTDGTVIVGSVGATDNRLVRSDGTGAATVQSTGITVDDSNNVSGVGTLATTGAVTIAATTPQLYLNKSASGAENQIFGRLAGNDHWILLFGNADAVTGSGNAGDNFELKRRTDAGGGLGSPLTITRSSGLITIEGQIAMPATQNASAGANTWDDYEEGTNTPAHNFGGGAVGLTYQASGGQEGLYTKNGRNVHLRERIKLLTKGSSTGTANMTGMPFTVYGTATVACSFYTGFSGLVSAPIGGLAIAAGTTVTMSQFAATARADITHAEMTDSSDYIFDGVHAV